MKKAVLKDIPYILGFASKKKIFYQNGQ